jgi:hypothetical protein
MPPVEKCQALVAVSKTMPRVMVIPKKFGLEILPPPGV